MATVTRQFAPYVNPATGAEKRSDVWFAVADAVGLPASVNSTAEQVKIGQTGGKGAVFIGITQLYDLSSLPPGVELTRAKMEVRAQSTDSSSVTLYFSCMSESNSADSANESYAPRDVVRMTGGRFLCTVNGSVGAASSLNTISGEDSQLDMAFDNDRAMKLDDGTMRVAQSMPLDVGSGSQTITSVFFDLESSTESIGDGTMSVEIYAATGHAGAYAKGALLGTSAGRGFADVPAAPGATRSFTFSPAISYTVGDVILCEFVLEPDFDHAAGAFVALNIDSGVAGTTGNMTVYGRQLVGFGNHHNFYAGTDLGITGQAANGTAAVAMPAFTSGDLYAFGEASDWPSVDMDIGLKAALQTWIDDSMVEGFLGLRCRTSGSTAAGDLRWWYSSRSPTATTDGLHGAVLTIEYEASSVCDFGLELAPAVKDFGIAIAPAVSDFGLTTALAVSDFGLSLESAVTDQGLEIAPAVKDFGLELEKC